MAYSDPVKRYVSAQECISIAQRDSVDLIKDRNWNTELLAENLEFMEILIDTQLQLEANARGEVVLAEKKVELSLKNVKIREGFTLTRASVVLGHTLVLERSSLRGKNGIVLRVDTDIQEPKAEVYAEERPEQARQKIVQDYIKDAIWREKPAQDARKEIGRLAEEWERVLMEELLSEGIRRSAQESAQEGVTVASRRTAGFMYELEKTAVENREAETRRLIERQARERAIAETQKVLVYCHD
jgi:hypothetical protein